MGCLTDGQLAGQLDGEREFKVFLGKAVGDIGNMHGVTSAAELKGDELGNLLAKFVDIWTTKCGKCDLLTPLSRLYFQDGNSSFWSF